MPARSSGISRDSRGAVSTLSTSSCVVARRTVQFHRKRDRRRASNRVASTRMNRPEDPATPVAKSPKRDVNGKRRVIHRALRRTWCRARHSARRTTSTARVRSRSRHQHDAALRVEGDTRTGLVAACRIEELTLPFCRTAVSMRPRHRSASPDDHCPTRPRGSTTCRRPGPRSRRPRWRPNTLPRGTSQPVGADGRDS